MKKYLHETLLMPQLTSGVDDFLMRLKALLALGTNHVFTGQVNKSAKTEGLEM